MFIMLGTVDLDLATAHSLTWIKAGAFWLVGYWHKADSPALPSNVGFQEKNGRAVYAGRGQLLTQLYGPAVRCKPNVSKRRGLVLRICIRPLHGAFVLLAIMDIRAHLISFSERP